MKKSTIIISLLIALIQFCAGTCLAQVSPVWQTYFGGHGSEYVLCTFLCNNGDVLVGGGSSSNTGMPNSLAVSNVYSGGVQDAFLARFDGEGDLLWWTFYGSSQTDYFQKLWETEEGDIWTLGYTSGNVPTSPNAIKSSQSGQFVSDCFVSKFSENGEWVDGTLFGGNDVDIPTVLGVNSMGQVILAGTTRSVGLGQGVVYDSELSTEVAYFVAVLNSVSSVESCSYYEGDESIWIGNNTSGTGFYTDDDNIIFYAATEAISGIATEGAEFPDPFESNTGCIVKLSPQGFPVWGTYYNYQSGNRNCSPLGNDLFAVYGVAYPEPNIATQGVHQQDFIGNYDGFLSVWTQDGELLWTTYFGGEEQGVFGDQIRSVALYEDRILFTGIASNGYNLSTNGAWQTDISDAQNTGLAYFGWFDLSGDLQYCTYIVNPTSYASCSNMQMSESSIYLPIYLSEYYEWVESPQLNQTPGGEADLCLMKWDLTNAIQEFHEVKTIDCFPNPTQDKLYLTGVNTVNARVLIFDATGKQCSDQIIKQEVDVSALEPGLYLAHVITTNGQRYSTRFLKQ